MLSRDEELLRRQSGTGEHVGEGIFDIDESSKGQPFAELSSVSSSSSLRQHSPLSRTSTSGSSTSSHEHAVPIVSPSNSNIKVQVSPRFKPEPKEAGGLSDPQSTLPQGGPSPSPSPPFDESTLQQTPPSVVTPSKQVCTVGTSSGRPNAWSKPLPGTGLSALRQAQSRQPVPFSHQTHWEAEAERIRRVEDPELRFALETSLAEAQSWAGGT
jgi:hypothetical protein